MSSPITSPRALRRRDAALADRVAAETEATRLANEKLAAEAAVARAEAEAKIAEAQARVAEINRQAERKQQREDAVEQARAKKQRKADRAAARKEMFAALADRQVLLVVVVGIVLSVSIALPAQISFLATRWVMPAAVVGGLLPECLTWVFAILGKHREAKGLSARFHHVGTWVAALTAAGINLWHGSHMWGVQFGVIAALGSLAAPIQWEAYRLARSDEDSDLSPEERRFHRRRRRHHPRVSRIAARIRTASVIELSADEAWVLAWRAYHGAEPGVTERLLRRHQRASRRIANLVRVAELHSVQTPALDALAPAVDTPGLPDPDAVHRSIHEAFDAARPIASLLGTGVYVHGRQALTAAPSAPSTPDPAEAPKTPPKKTSTKITKLLVNPSNPPSRKKLSTAAAQTARQGVSAAVRKAQAETARGATAEERDAARKRALDSLEKTRKADWKDLNREFGRSRAWCYERINEAVQEYNLAHPNNPISLGKED